MAVLCSNKALFIGPWAGICVVVVVTGLVQQRHGVRKLENQLVIPL